MVTLFFPTSSFAAWLTSAEYPPMFHLVARISLSIPTLVGIFLCLFHLFHFAVIHPRTAHFNGKHSFLLFVDYSGVDYVDPHLNAVCINWYIPWCLRTPILIRRFGLALWIPWSGGTQRQFLENICSEDDLRSRIFGTFVVKFLACLPLLRFSNI